MSIPIKAKGTIRTLKNFSKGFSDIQKKVREATSNDPVGPNGALMNDISRATFSHHLFLDVVDIIDKRLNDSGKNWRHVFKALTLMEYLIHNGSEEVVIHCKSSLYLIKTLREFQYVDEQGKDHGMNIRHKAKDITDILTNEDKLKEARAHLRDSNYGGGGGYGNYGGETGSYANGGNYGENTGYGYGRTSPDRYGQTSYGQASGATNSAEDRELAMAIEESKRLAQNQNQKPSQALDTDDDLRKAIELSKREAELREQSLSKENELVLLDGYDPNEKPAPQFNHIKQYDFFGNLVNDPQPTQKSGQHDLLDLDPLSFSTSQNYGNNHTTQQNFGQTNPFSFGTNTNTNTGIFSNPNPNPPPPSNYNGLNNAFNQLNMNHSPSPQSQSSNASPGFNSQFKDAFDGGFNAKLMPHQTQNNANAALATIARNAVKIDPFASLAAARSSSSPSQPSNFNGTSATYSPASNPFQGTWSNATSNTPPPAAPSSNGTPNSLDLFNPPQSSAAPGNPFAAFHSTPPASSSSNRQPSHQDQNNLFF